jgi:hypothetical protein
LSHFEIATQISCRRGPSHHHMSSSSSPSFQQTPLTSQGPQILRCHMSSHMSSPDITSQGPHASRHAHHFEQQHPAPFRSPISRRGDPFTSQPPAPGPHLTSQPSHVAAPGPGTPVTVSHEQPRRSIRYQVAAARDAHFEQQQQQQPAPSHSQPQRIRRRPDVTSRPIISRRSPSSDTAPIISRRSPRLPQPTPATLKSQPTHVAAPVIITLAVAPASSPG